MTMSPPLRLVKTTIEELFKLKWQEQLDLVCFPFQQFGVPVPPVVTLYLALIFTQLWRGQKTHGTEERHPKV